MSWAMRILLILGSVMTAVYVLRRVRNSRMRTGDSVFWLFFSLILVLLGIFPGIAIRFSEWIGVQSAANLVFLIVIFLLIIKLFLMDQRISKLDMQITRTVQTIAIHEREGEAREEENRDKEEK